MLTATGAVAADQATGATAGLIFGLPASLYHLRAQGKRNEDAFGALKDQRDAVQRWLTTYEAEFSGKPDDLAVLKPVRETLTVINDYIRRTEDPNWKKKISMTLRVDHTAGRIDEMGDTLSASIQDAMLLMLNRVHIITSQGKDETLAQLQTMSGDITQMSRSLSSLVRKAGTFPSAADVTDAVRPMIEQANTEILTLCREVKTSIGALEDQFAPIRETLRDVVDELTIVRRELQEQRTLTAAQHAEQMAAHANILAAVQAGGTDTAQLLALMQKLLAQQAAQAPLQHALPDQNTDVIDRGADDSGVTDSQRVEHLLYPEGGTSSTGRVRGIVGPGGTGKSTLAIQLGHWSIGQGRHDFVYYMNMDRQNQEASWKKLATHLGLSTETQRQDDEPLLPKIQKAIFERIGTRSFLLIFDNLQGMSHAELAALTNLGTNQHILVTLRNAEGWPEGHYMLLTPFNRSDSIAYIERRLTLSGKGSIAGSPTFQTQADRLSELLGDLPLALRIAMAPVCNQGQTLESVTDTLEQKGLTAADTDSEAVITNLWDPASEDLTTECGHYSPAELMGFISLMSPDNIPFLLLQELCGTEEDLIACLEILGENGHNLVTQQLDPSLPSTETLNLNTLSIHRVLQAVVCRERVHVSRSLQEGEHSTPRTFEEAEKQFMVNPILVPAADFTGLVTNWLSPLANAIIACIPKEPGQAKDYALMHCLESQLRQLLRILPNPNPYEEAEPDEEKDSPDDEALKQSYNEFRAKVIHHVARCRLGTDDVLGCFLAFVDVDTHLCRLSDESDYQGPISKVDNILGLSELYENDVGDMLEARWGYKSYLEYHQKALKTAPIEDHDNLKLQIATALNGMGRVLTHLGCFDKARKSFREAKAVIDETTSPSPRVLADYHRGLGRCLQEEVTYDATGEKDYDEALTEYDTALGLYLENFGEAHRSHIETLRQVAAIHVQQGQYDKADAMYQHAYNLIVDTLGTYHPQAAITIREMGIASVARSEDETLRAEERSASRQKARLQLTVAIKLLNEAHGHLFSEEDGDPGSRVRHVSIVRTLDYLAKLHEYDNMWSEAMQCYQIILNSSTHPDAHPYVIGINVRLGIAQLHYMRACLATPSSEALPAGFWEPKSLAGYTKAIQGIRAMLSEDGQFFDKAREYLSRMSLEIGDFRFRLIEQLTAEEPDPRLPSMEDIASIFGDINKMLGEIDQAIEDKKASEDSEDGEKPDDDRRAGAGMFDRSGADATARPEEGCEDGLGDDEVPAVDEGASDEDDEEDDQDLDTDPGMKGGPG